MAELTKCEGHCCVVAVHWMCCYCADGCISWWCEVDNWVLWYCTTASAVTATGKNVLRHDSYFGLLLTDRMSGAAYTTHSNNNYCYIVVRNTNSSLAVIESHDQHYEHVLPPSYAERTVLPVKNRINIACWIRLLSLIQFPLERNRINCRLDCRLVPNYVQTSELV